MAELLERDAHIPTLPIIVVMAECFLRAKRRGPQHRRQIWVGLETQRCRRTQYLLEAVDEAGDLAGNRLGALQQLCRRINLA